MAYIEEGIENLMRALLQRTRSASVSINGEIVGKINKGLVILLGIRRGDTEKEAIFLAEKCANLRIFSDRNGKINCSALDLGAEILVVSQFTLYGDCRKGRRPNFMEAAPPEQSEPLYNLFITATKKLGIQTASGRFGATMLVDLQNDGPMTVLVES